MKVIDLLNKIANGEEVPKKIIFNDIEYEYIKPQYQRVDKKDYSNLWSGYNFRILNDEVEIIEEKKIPEKIEYYDDSIAWVIDGVGKLSDVDKIIIDKFNEVLDYLNSKGNE